LLEYMTVIHAQAEVAVAGIKTKAHVPD
jgi:hypothetical protein